MKRFHVMLMIPLACAALVASSAITAREVHAAGLSVGNGCSELQDARGAGAEAASEAKAGLGGQDAKLVLVFDAVAANPKAKQSLLAGVTSVFNPAIVYGCSAYAPLTQDSNTGTVGVLAIGGDVRLTATKADLQGGHLQCGKRIGQALKPAGASQTPGRLLILFGSCHVDSNDSLVKGVCSVLGEKFPAAGGAASKGEFLYYRGKLLEDKSNVGLLLSGDFRCSFSAGNAPSGRRERVIAVAGEAAERALGDDKDAAMLVFAFDCGGRRGQMGDGVEHELEVMRRAVGNAPLFGFYGSGEIGPKDNDSPPRGVGHHIIICALLSR